MQTTDSKLFEERDSRYTLLTHVNRLLNQPRRSPIKQQRLLRLMRRCGECALPQAVPHLLRFQPQDAQHAYTQAWALGRCGSGNTWVANTLQALTDHQDVRVQGMAQQALLQVTPTEQRHRLLEQALAALPTDLLQALQQPTQAQARDAVWQWLIQQPPATGHLALVNVYLLAWYEVGECQTWTAVLQQLWTQPNSTDHWAWQVLYELAEFQQDAALWAVLVYQLDKQHEVQPPTPLSPHPQDHFRRQAWRTLRRLALQDNAYFVRLAAALLQHYPAGCFNNHFSFTHLLRRSATPPFSTLWAQAPDTVWQLLETSQNTAVQALMLKHLPAEIYHARVQQDRSTLVQHLAAASPAIRQAARHSMDQLSLPQRWSQTDWLLALVLSPYADNWEAAQVYTAQIPTESLRHRILEQLLLAIKQWPLTQYAYSATIQQAQALILSAFAVPVQTVETALLHDLAQHPQPVVQRLGAALIKAQTKTQPQATIAATTPPLVTPKTKLSPTGLVTWLRSWWR